MTAKGFFGIYRNNRLIEIESINHGYGEELAVVSVLTDIRKINGIKG